MMTMRYLILLLMTTLTAHAYADGEDTTLVINELMQSNIDCVMDDLNEFPDSWVELYNPGGQSVNLQDYKIGITPDAADAWQLPNQKMNGGSRLLVYCDKEGKKLHTNFRLESGKGCQVFLFKGNQVVDQVTDLKKQPAPNIAYGRKTDGSNEWGYQLTATPAAENCGTVCDRDHILGDPVFSETGRVTTGKDYITLTLSLPPESPEGTVIRYTLDGTEPTAGSLQYKAPLTFSTTQVVKARLFCDGWLSPMAKTESYIYFPRDVTLPVVSVVTNNKYLNDSKLGIFANNNGNYRTDWRRPINIEFFFGEEQPSVINQLCETRVAGAASRGAQKKSMALYAHKRFGTKRFDYEFFPDQKPGLTDFKSLVLRNAGNDFDYLYMRDAIAQRTMATHTDLDWQAWQPAIVYINGIYHGMLNIRERANENNVYTNYDGLEDIDLIENWSDLKEGSLDNLNQFKAFYNEHGHTMAEYEEWMDCQEFINLMVMNLYYNNYDFPGNNIIMWRPRTEGGRWRWIAKDVDYIMGLYGDPYNFKILEWLHNPSYDSSHNWGANGSSATRLFRRLMEDDDFKRTFIDCAVIYLGDFLNADGTWRVWEPMYKTISYEYPYHRELINKWWPNYNDELNNARNWLKQRTPEFYNQLADYYSLGTLIPLNINSPQGTRIHFNGVSLTNSTFRGKFFADRDITLTAEPTEGKTVTSWQIIRVTSSGTATTEVPGSQLVTTMPSCYSVIINPLFEDTGIDLLTIDAVPSDVFDLQGRKVRSRTTSLDGLPRGVYIVRGKKVAVN